ncbi:MAG TPA: BatD family protein, partial [Acetobacteraceae bacterium]|nr:BatD family protein [Acetobacteraceae bacterium]
RLFTTSTLYRADLELPENGDVVAKQVGSDENGSAERNGRTYQVITRHYVLFPLHSGKLTLQGPVLDAEIASNQPRRPFGSDPFGGFFGGPFFRTVRPVRLHGKPIVLAVRARPASAVGSYWLPARNVTLDATWDPTQLSAHTGDPITLDVTLQATGLTAAQLPDLSPLLGFPSGLKAYPDQPKLKDSVRDGMVVGSRDQTIALMADTPGRYTIPALTVTWWDTKSNQPRVTTLPARTLAILPAPGGVAAGAAAPPAPAAQPASAPIMSQQSRPGAAAQKAAPVRPSSQWQWISIGLAAVWLTTLGAWLWSRRSRPPRVPAPLGRAQPEPSKERSAFRTACQAHDAHAARAHLMTWAAAHWGATPTGVNAIAARIGDPVVADLLRDLDRACYAGGAWQGHSLAAAITELPTSPQESAHQRNRLAPLYP